MGIPHLITTLEPLAARGSLKDEDIVIDGPALAYHILSVCRRNGISQPSYGILGRTAVSWLDKLSINSNIKAIFFDGHLPASKLPVRMERMVKSTSQLNQFHAICSDGCAGRHMLPEDADADIVLFTSRQPETRQPPVPPFLVPAVIDALKNSPKFRGRVHQVPGEADAFCAKHLASHGGIVLTSDSDLLVHDLVEGRVVFFRDTHTSSNDGLQVLVYEPRTICRRLGLAPGDACRLGYQVYCSPHSTLSQLARDCLEPISNTREYEEFCQQYLHYEMGPVPVMLNEAPLPLQHLDPRLSELAIQFGTQDGDSSARMFLPILVESPMRGSAWEQSTPIRQIAYTLLKQLVPGTTTAVDEYRRVQAQQQKGKTVPVLSKGLISGTMQTLIKSMTESESTGETTAGSMWRALALILDIRAGEEQGRKSPCLRIIEQWSRPATLSLSAKVPWDIIHFTCQMQASYYSFRMLKQVLSLVPAASWDSDMPPEAKILHEKLAHAPPLSEYPNVAGSIQFLGTLPGSRFLDSMRQLVDIRIPVDEESSTKKRKKSKKEQNSPSSKKTTAQKNMPSGGSRFSLLLDE